MEASAGKQTETMWTTVNEVIMVTRWAVFSSLALSDFRIEKAFYLLDTLYM